MRKLSHLIIIPRKDEEGRYFRDLRSAMAIKNTLSFLGIRNVVASLLKRDFESLILYSPV